MALRVRNRRKRTAEVSTHSLNDIMFFLMLFFLLISTMANEYVIKVLLPKASTGEQTTEKVIEIAIDKNKEYRINNVPISEEQLQEKLTEAIKGMTEPVAAISIDRDLPVQDLVTVMENCAKLKIRAFLRTTRSD